MDPQVPSTLEGKSALAIAKPRALAVQADLPLVLTATPNLPGLLHALRRRWRIAAFLGLLAAGAVAGAIWFVLPEQYTARTLVQLLPPESVLQSKASGARTDQRTQIALAKSRLVLNTALRDAKLTEIKIIKEQIDAVAWLEKEVQADFSVAPDILRIHMTGAKPDDLTKIVNAVRLAYIKEIQDRSNDSSRERLKTLNEIKKVFENSLIEKRRGLRIAAENVGALNDPKTVEKILDLNLKALESLFRELLQTQLKLMRARMDLSVRQNQSKDEKAPLPANLIDNVIKTDESILFQQKYIAQLDIEIEQMKNRFVEPDKEPALKRKIEVRKNAQSELESWKEKMRTTLLGKLRDGVSKTLDVLTEEIGYLDRQEKWLAEEVDKRNVAQKEFKKQLVDVEWLKGEISLDVKLVDKLHWQIQGLELDQKVQRQQIILEEGTAVPNKSNRVRTAGMAGGGVLALFFMGIAFLEFYSRKVSNVDEVVRGLKLRLVGAIPSLSNVPKRLRRHPPGTIAAHNYLLESIDATRTMLLYAVQADSLRIIVVTSAVGGEGKTLTATHLAASLARAGRKTLLIDGDLRRPSLQKLFNLPIKPGLSELLRGEVVVPDAVQDTPVNGLSVITAGASDSLAIQALALPVLDAIFRQLREQFEFIIVDSTPVLPVADVQQFGQCADGVIFSILKDVSRLPQVYAAHERLAQLGIRILGAVVNGVDENSYSSGYAYGHVPG